MIGIVGGGLAGLEQGPRRPPEAPPPDQAGQQSGFHHCGRRGGQHLQQ